MLPTTRILILDFGSQYTQLIARTIRQLEVYSEVLPFNTDENTIRAFNPTGIILSGGPDSLRGDNAPRAPDLVFHLNIPVLGICYGMQTMVEQLGGEVENADKHEYGHAELTLLNKQNPLFKDIDDTLNAKGEACLDVWMSHGDRVIALPDGFEVSASTEHSPFAAVANINQSFYGLQFHPEVTHTHQGRRILARFVKEICQCSSEWNSQFVVKHQIEAIREQVGQDKVILGLSGGVDSQVAAALLHRAIGDQLICIYVDTGLMRLNETDDVMQALKVHEGVQIESIDAKDRFFTSLAGITDPEAKRKIIGKLFIDVFTEAASRFEGVSYLAQGTIYSDVIESAGSSSNQAKIKSHHNVGGLPEKMSLELVEPLRELFKDEVRSLGLELGLPYENIYRHPFPGPGLGVRILGEVKAQYVDILQKADAIFIQQLKEHNLYHKVAQAFAVFLPVKSVGVAGDARRYDYVICLRAVESTDFMTANYSPLPHEFLGITARKILNEVPGVSRVTYDISSKPPATIEWE